MLGNFSYCNPTKLYFGENSLSNLSDELRKYGDNVVLVYGTGSIKKNGIYDDIIKILKESNKNITEIEGVMPNPTVEKLYEGIEIARNHNADFILAVGGGSVCDFSKALSVSVNCNEDPWEKYFVRFEEPNCEIIPIGCVLTMVGTGSEMNAGSVITNQNTKEKIGHVFADEKIMPRFTILNPRFTIDNTSDYISEALMKSVMHSSLVAVKNPNDYEARSNIMWTATWALNTLIAKGKTTDWEVHMLGQAVGGYTNATHGMTLSAVSLAYYRYIMPYGLDKFKRFAINVWSVSPQGKTDEQIAKEGLLAMENWMNEIGAITNISDLGVTKDDIENIADLTLTMDGGYKTLSRDEKIKVLSDSL